MMAKRMAALFLLALCALSPCAEAVEITLIHGWGTMEAEHVAMREIYSGFMHARPDVTLTLISMPDTEQALAKAGDMLSVGEAPDILFTAGVHSALIDFMIEKGYALNLAPYLRADEAFLGSVSSLALSQWTYPDGALYTLSDVMWQSGLWLNRTVLTQAGISDAPGDWDGFFAACDQIARFSEENGRDVIPVALTMEDAANLLQIVVAGMEPEKTVANAECLPEALMILKRLFSYAGEASATYQYRDTLSLFNQGRTVFYINGIWASGMIDQNVNAECVAYPGAAGSVSGQAALCGYVLGDTGDDERMEASVAFVKYMLAMDTQTLLLTRTGQFPSNPNMRFEEIPGVTKRFLGAAKAIRGADIYSLTLGLIYSEENTARLTDILRAYLLGRIPADEAASRIRAIDHR